jgi:type III pantothenate kinase
MASVKSQTLLCIDVGNTSVNYGLFKNGRLTKEGRTPTKTIPKLTLNLMMNVERTPITQLIISSVVPQISLKMRTSIKHIKGAKVLEVGKNLKVPMVSKYRHRNRLGADRLVNAFGALKIYGSPVLIMDFGTALTCDYVSKKGVFEGGLIIPGPQIALEVLSQRTALLPKVSFPNKKGSLIGRDTVSCMKYGILQGYGTMAEGLVQRFKAKYGRSLKVVVTGGLAKLISGHVRGVDIVDPLLTLKSLARLAQLAR